MPNSWSLADREEFLFSHTRIFSALICFRFYKMHLQKITMHVPKLIDTLRMSPATKKRCPHDKPPYLCRDCRGGSFCTHGKKKWYCRMCSTRTCDHGKVRYFCRECRGGAFCLHGKKRWYCPKCSARTCDHGKVRYFCRDCRGGAFCSHGRRKYSCKEHHAPQSTLSAPVVPATSDHPTENCGKTPPPPPPDSDSEIRIRNSDTPSPKEETESVSETSQPDPDDFLPKLLTFLSL